MDEIMKLEGTEIIEKEEKGASMLEYALLAALIAVVCILAITILGQSACNAFSNVASAMTHAGAPAAGP